MVSTAAKPQRGQVRTDSRVGSGCMVASGFRTVESTNACGHLARGASRTLGVREVAPDMPMRKGSLERVATTSARDRPCTDALGTMRASVRAIRGQGRYRLGVGDLDRKGMVAFQAGVVGSHRGVSFLPGHDAQASASAARSVVLFPRSCSHIRPATCRWPPWCLPRRCRRT